MQGAANKGIQVYDSEGNTFVMWLIDPRSFMDLRFGKKVTRSLSMGLVWSMDLSVKLTLTYYNKFGRIMRFGLAEEK
ncbi:hypothetical protein BSZ32_09220 [Rubritalea profundi]|uniref:Uncharacterized protein n=1 Tax=Rubritalea profundi TaxID=1658618 RepID=A0A2S7U0Y6_9BACT|nr:hypothetical protein BSZ32_09220 [Rubritalea profundi]